MLETTSNSTSQWHSRPPCSLGARLSMARKWDLSYRVQELRSVGPPTIFSSAPWLLLASSTLALATPTLTTGAGRGLRTWTLSGACTLFHQAIRAPTWQEKLLLHWLLLPWSSEQLIRHTLDCCWELLRKSCSLQFNTEVLTVTPSALPFVHFTARIPVIRYCVLFILHPKNTNLQKWMMYRMNHSFLNLIFPLFTGWVIVGGSLALQSNEQRLLL